MTPRWSNPARRDDRSRSALGKFRSLPQQPSPPGAREEPADAGSSVAPERPQDLLARLGGPIPTITTIEDRLGVGGNKAGGSARHLCEPAVPAHCKEFQKGVSDTCGAMCVPNARGATQSPVLPRNPPYRTNRSHVLNSAQEVLSGGKSGPKSLSIRSLTPQRNMGEQATRTAMEEVGRHVGLARHPPGSFEAGFDQFIITKELAGMQ
jgi:hypothetical protein